MKIPYLLCFLITTVRVGEGLAPPALDCGASMRRYGAVWTRPYRTLNMHSVFRFIKSRLSELPALLRERSREPPCQPPRTLCHRL